MRSDTIYVVVWGDSYEDPSVAAHYTAGGAWQQSDTWRRQDSEANIAVVKIEAHPQGLVASYVPTEKRGDMTDTLTTTDAASPQVGETYTITDDFNGAHEVTVLYVDDVRVFATDPHGEFGDSSYSRDDFAWLVARAQPKQPAELPLTFWVEVANFGDRFGVNRHEISGNRARAEYEPQSRRDDCQWVQVQVVRRLATEA